MTVAAVDGQNQDIIEFYPSSTTNSVSDWIGDKGKYFCEAMANFSFYISQAPKFFGHAESKAWGDVSKGMSASKKFLAFPSIF